MKILIGLWKYFAISKRFWIHYKEFRETLNQLWESFKGLKKVNENLLKFYEKLKFIKNLTNMEKFWKNCKIFRKF